MVLAPPMTTASVLGLRAMRGGAVVVMVSVAGGEPHILRSTSLATTRDGDRLSFEPYHVAVELAASHGLAAAEHAVAEGRVRQEKLAAGAIERLLQDLPADMPSPTRAALLVNRAGWMTDLLSYSLAWPDHPPIAEGLAVREALRKGLAPTGLDCVEVDEKTLSARAAERFGPAELDAAIKIAGAQAGKPWRKEQKLAFLAAWLVAAGER